MAADDKPKPPTPAQPTTPPADPKATVELTRLLESDKNDRSTKK